MKIIYHCFGGSHSSVTAAGIHLGMLPIDTIPSKEMLEKVPYFDGQVKKDHGHIRLMGIDEYNNEIYVAGRRKVTHVFENAVTGMAHILGSDDLFLVNCMPYVNWKMVIGGYTSRKLGLVSIGRPIVISGIKYSYLKLVSLVQNVKVLVASNTYDVDLNRGG